MLENGQVGGGNCRGKPITGQYGGSSFTIHGKNMHHWAGNGGRCRVKIKEKKRRMAVV